MATIRGQTVAGDRMRTYLSTKYTKDTKNGKRITVQG